MSTVQINTPRRALRAIVKFNIKLRTVTGLLIRMPVQAQVFRVGGADQYPMVTRKIYIIDGEPIELEVPYIPGSSIKGRMRSLLELALERELYTADPDFKIWQHMRSINIRFSKLEVKSESERRKKIAEIFKRDVEERCTICDLFGWPAANYQQIREYIKEMCGKEEEAEKTTRELFEKLAPTRLMVSDFFPDDEYVKRNNIKSIADFLEEKSENRIDRVTSAADPRNIVRVKPEVVFSGTLTLLLFDNDRDYVERYLRTIAIGLKLVEETYLGGCGSRGYGRVKFEHINLVAEKVIVRSTYPSLEEIKLGKQSFRNVDELIEAVPEIAKTIVESAYQTK